MIAVYQPPTPRARIFGPRHLPCCDNQRVVLTQSSAGKIRRCEICGTRYRLVEKPVDEHVRLAAGKELRKFVLELVDA